MRFKTDENIHPDIAAYLRDQGHDALTVWDQSLRGTTDENRAQVCQSERRALITLDLDFSDIRSYAPEQFPGIVVRRLGSQSRRHVLDSMARVLPMMTEDGVTGHLWIVDEQNVRVRGAD